MSVIVVRPDARIGVRAKAASSRRVTRRWRLIGAILRLTWAASPAGVFGTGAFGRQAVQAHRAKVPELELHVFVMCKELAQAAADQCTPIRKLHLRRNAVQPLELLS